MSSGLSDEEDETQCPLCVEEMDLSDKNFLPCPCGYRVCMWCWHHIRENLNGLCPACRTPYNADPHAFSAVDRQEIVRKNRERKQKERLDKKISDKPISSLSSTSSASSVKPLSSLVDRRHLHNYRVVQRNLVYVIGVPNNLANEELLRKPEYFGQYGKIGKIVIHRNLSSSHATASAYVTFLYKDDAKASIQSLDGFWLDGHVLRASFGTTKYCNNFIRGISCNNPECVYLHDLGDDDDRFTKEEIQAGHSKLSQVPGKDQTIVTGNGGPSGTGKRPTGESILPPPVFIQDIVHTNKTVSSKTSAVLMESAVLPDASRNCASDTKDIDMGLVSDLKLVKCNKEEPLFENSDEVAEVSVTSDTKEESVVTNIIRNHVGLETRSVIFNGIATCAVFPVPVSSFSSNIWDLILRSSKDFPNKNPYESVGVPFSDILDLTLPPVDAANSSNLSKGLPQGSQRESTLEVSVVDTSVHSHSMSTTSAHSKTSSILALRQIFPGVNMNVGVPSSVGNS